MMTVSDAAKKWSALTGRHITYDKVMSWIQEGRVRVDRVPQVHGVAVMVLDELPPGPTAVPIPPQEGRRRLGRKDGLVADALVQQGQQGQGQAQPSQQAQPAQVAGMEAAGVVVAAATCASCGLPLGRGAWEYELNGETVGIHPQCA
mgnify:CR=1 FL=1